ncbi:MAG: hypothetical protein KGH96_20390 [Sphingomonadales bacterium]|nr:hypothetical protein [Sphingomonadales bacterium]
MPPTVVAMASCWYTRDHRPSQTPPLSRDGEPTYARCRHCHRDIASHNGQDWHIAGGFNAEAAGRNHAQAFLSVVDVLDEIVVARFPIGAMNDEDEIRAFKAQLRLRYAMDAPESMLELRDSRYGRMLA